VRWLFLVLLIACRPMSIALANRPCDVHGNCVTGYFCDHRVNACLLNSQRQPEVADFSASDGEDARVVLT
jgi:hypothetical protein